MVDTLDAVRRSWNMSRIRNRNTKPELIVRSLLHRMGYRFTLNGPLNKKLPGHPDIVLPKHRTLIFVHGCFWHRHEGCRDTTTPKTRTAWWIKKLSGNVARDKKNQSALRDAGWNVITLWECEAARPRELEHILKSAVHKPISYPRPRITSKQLRRNGPPG
jgi:DNA mismatch endonuclease (patch repair protein)